jgi:hypothetical protein
MPLKKQMVVVEGWIHVPAEAGDHPEHPIYIPVEPPPDSGLSPEHPIYVPVYPSHPIELPDLPPISELPPSAIERLKEFLFGNLPPGPTGPAYPSPVGTRPLS